MTERLLSELRGRNILVQDINHQEAVAARLAKRDPAFTDATENWSGCAGNPGAE
ncbi:hypothetical protein V1277_005349 [Bradyrhizobium sp. AZCC 1588]|uniref:hypothetical protein n=1 Tax=Bradyrhizobium sp. AZCC 1588 TaxID=3117018 RepID=UPI002FF2C3FB